MFKEIRISYFHTTIRLFLSNKKKSFYLKRMTILLQKKFCQGKVTNIWVRYQIFLSHKRFLALLRQCYFLKS